MRLTARKHTLRISYTVLACAVVIACTRPTTTGVGINLGGEVGAVSLSATLFGASEVPGPGDPDGRGVARITFHGARGDVCFEINVSDIDSAIAANIHEGLAGANGRVVVPLAPPTDGFVSDCTSGISPGVMLMIYENPTNFYVNVYTTPFPDGALRGQMTH